MQSGVIPERTMKQELAHIHEAINRLWCERLVNAGNARKRHKEVLAENRSIEVQLANVFEGVQELIDNAHGTPTPTPASPDATTPAPKGRRGRKSRQAHVALFINQFRNDGKTWPEILRLYNDVFKRQFNKWERMRDIWRRYYGDKKPELYPDVAHPELQIDPEKQAKVGRTK